MEAPPFTRNTQVYSKLQVKWNERKKTKKVGVKRDFTVEDTDVAKRTVHHTDIKRRKASISFSDAVPDYCLSKKTQSGRGGCIGGYTFEFVGMYLRILPILVLTQ